MPEEVLTSEKVLTSFTLSFSPSLSRDFARCFIDQEGGKKHLISRLPDRNKSRTIVTPAGKTRKRTAIALLDGFLLEVYQPRKRLSLYHPK